MKILILGFLFICTSCAQLNLASSVVNITVIKIQHDSEDAKMDGSKLDDIAEGMKQDAGDVTAK